MIPVFTLTGQSASGEPIGVKVMKKRLLQVHVYKITRDDPTSSTVPVDDKMVPTKAELEAHLNNLFGPQINTWFEVTLHDTAVPVNWAPRLDDGTSDTTFHNHNIGNGDNSPVMSLITGRAPVMGHITIYLIGTTVPLGDKSDALGFTHRKERTCWILGSDISDRKSEAKQLENYKDKAQTMDTIGHEVGHIFFGPGHPDSPPDEDDGPARLNGTDPSRRLMVRGRNPGSGPNSRLTVKREWDEAEDWMSKNIDQ